jgi:hypothetical protein
MHDRVPKAIWRGPRVGPAEELGQRVAGKVLAVGVREAPVNLEAELGGVAGEEVHHQLDGWLRAVDRLEIRGVALVQPLQPETPCGPVGSVDARQPTVGDDDRHLTALGFVARRGAPLGLDLGGEASDHVSPAEFEWDIDLGSALVELAVVVDLGV